MKLFCHLGFHIWQHGEYPVKDLEEEARIIFTAGAYYQWRFCTRCGKVEGYISKTNDGRIYYSAWERIKDPHHIRRVIRELRSEAYTNVR